MSLSDGYPIPQPPTLYPVYRGFYILPTENLGATIVRIDFFVSRSNDDIAWNTPTLLSYGDRSIGLYAVHSGLDENTFYSYQVQYVFADGSKSPLGQRASAGQAQLLASPSLNIDQLASRAYSTGLITAGTFRGVIFETSAVNPKVRMDPSGIFATNSINARTFFIDAVTGNVTVTGTINATSGAFSGNITSSATIQGGTFVTGSSYGAGGTYTQLTTTGITCASGTNGSLTITPSGGITIPAGAGQFNNITWETIDGSGNNVDIAAWMVGGVDSGDATKRFWQLNVSKSGFTSGSPAANSLSGISVYKGTSNDSGNTVTASASNAASSTTYTKNLIRGNSASDYPQLFDSSTNGTRFMIWKNFTPINVTALGAGATQTSTWTYGSLNLAAYTAARPLMFVDGAAGSGMSSCGIALVGYTDTSVTVEIHNLGSGACTGHVNLMLFAWVEY